MGLSSYLGFHWSFTKSWYATFYVLSIYWCFHSVISLHNLNYSIMKVFLSGSIFLLSGRLNLNTNLGVHRASHQITLSQEGSISWLNMQQFWKTASFPCPCMYTNACIYIYVCVCMCVFIYPNVCIQVFVCIDICIRNKCDACSTKRPNSVSYLK